MYSENVTPEKFGECAEQSVLRMMPIQLGGEWNLETMGVALLVLCIIYGVP